MGITTAPSTGAIMRSLPLHKAGVGSAVNDTTRELGGALGVAVLGSLVASQFHSFVAASLAGSRGRDALARRGARQGRRWAARAVASSPHAAQQAYVDAFDVTLVVAAVVVVVAAGVNWFCCARPRRPWWPNRRRPYSRRRSVGGDGSVGRVSGGRGDRARRRAPGVRRPGATGARAHPRPADGAMPCGEIQLESVGKSTGSHHLKVLREAGVVTARVDGTRRYYTLRRDDLDARFPGLLASVLRAEA